MHQVLSFKAIFVGFLVKVLSGTIFGNGVTIATMIAAPTFSGNAVSPVQALTIAFTSPLFIIATTAAAVLSALLSGYVTSALAPGAEMRHLAVVVAIFVAWTLGDTYIRFLIPPLPAGMMTFPTTSPRAILWISLAANMLSIPAFFGAAALRAR